ncbi:MAG: DUF2007 domain-containing protein [Acetobacteraceae bacterium]|nr:DUF2007 domain-containing protein [Acetobacteraceae bacterium]
MRILLRETDPIRMGFLVLLLREGGIEAEVLDRATSQALGGLPALPMRLAVAEHDAARALRLLRDAGELPASRDPG